MAVELEDFEAEATSVLYTAPSAPDPIEEARKAARTAAYEEGYRSGWDDSARATESEGKAVGEELGRNLRDLGFTYFEARSEILDLMKSFMAELFDRLFPALLPEAVAATLAAEIINLAGELGDGRLEVLVSPDDSATVKRLLSDAGIADLTVRDEPALAAGQARLHAAAAEVSIDAERLIRTLREALGPTATLKELAHG